MTIAKNLGNNFLLFFALLLISADTAILLDIPFIRQIIGFLFLTLLPGLLILQILSVNKLEFTEKFVLSVGLSISFLMIFGLLINNLSLGLGYETPLSTIPLLVSFNVIYVILAIIGYRVNKKPVFSLPNLNLSNSEKAFLTVPIFFPVLCIFGMHVMNTTDNNSILMFFLFLIPIYVAFVCFFNHKFPKRLYPVVIFLISISLLLLYSLRSNHIIGSDTHRAFFIFQTILDNHHWSQLGFSTLDSCLSISLLPSVYQIFLNINQEFLFKILFSLICSILPLVVYLISKKYIGSFYAFLASVFFMSQILFQWTPSGARTSTATLFFALAIMVLFNERISEFNKRALFIIFAASIIVSHYGTTYIAFFVLLLTWIGMQIVSTLIFVRSNAGTTNLKPSPTWFKGSITLTPVVLFFVLLFFWHSQVISGSFNTGVRFLQQTVMNLKEEFFFPESRAYVVESALGGTLPYIGVAQKIEFVFSWLTILFIVFGILTTIIRFKEMVHIPGFGHIKSNLLVKKFEMDFFLLSILCFALVVATVILPYVALYYGSARTYFQMMVPLSAFFVIGGMTVAKYLKLRPHLLILIVLIPYFLCTTGAMCQVFGFPRAITLNSEGPLYTDMYVHDQESCAAKWIKDYGEEEERIYAQGFSREILVSQAKIPGYVTGSRISEFKVSKGLDGYIYLRYMDIVDGGLVSKYPRVFAEKGKIYATSRSEIYR